MLRLWLGTQCLGNAATNTAGQWKEDVAVKTFVSRVSPD